MKFAVCYSGQCRFPERRFSDNHEKNIFSVLRRYGEIDFFLHFWKSNDMSREGPLPDLDSAYAEGLLNLIKPKAYLFEPQKDQDKMLSMFESIHKSILLSSDYSWDNKFEYDAVLRMRADFGFNHELPEYILTELDRMHVRDAGGDEGINDQFAISDSVNMDLYGDCFLNIKSEMIGHPEKTLRQFFINSGLNDKVKLLPSTFFWF